MRQVDVCLRVGDSGTGSRDVDERRDVWIGDLVVVSARRERVCGRELTRSRGAVSSFMRRAKWCAFLLLLELRSFPVYQTEPRAPQCIYLFLMERSEFRSGEAACSSR
mgnify:CR=1 FL=1